MSTHESKDSLVPSPDLEGGEFLLPSSDLEEGADTYRLGGFHPVYKGTCTMTDMKS
jgi:hypothetical protein